MIKELYDLVTEIQNTQGTNDKKSILLREKGNEEFKNFLKYVIDPNLKYGIKEKKLQKYRGKVNNIIPFQNLFECYEYLLIHNTGKEEDVKLTQAYIESENEQYQDFLTKAITKSLKLGIEKKSIIECFPGLIDDFDVMRAKSYHDHIKKVKGKTFILDEKKNGIRCIYIKKGGEVIPKSRQNKIISGLKSLTAEISTLPDGVYEGELLIKNATDYYHQEVLQKTSEIVNSESVEDKELDYWIFDYTTIEEFNTCKTRKYFERHDSLPCLNKEFNHIKTIPELYRGNDIGVVQPLLEEYVSNGREGLMLHLDKPYKKGKTDYTLKVKMKYTSDLRCIGFKEGKRHTKYEGTLGSIEFDYKGFSLFVPSMDDGIRDEIWNNKDKYLDKIAEVSHFEESHNARGGTSVSYPSFIRWRDDKDTVDYAHE